MFLRILAAVAALPLVSCSSVGLDPSKVPAYRMEIQQGNFVSQEMVSQLKLGAIRAIVIKCARTGYTQSRQILALARSYYTPVHNGTQADMHIGSAAAAHFACSYRAIHAHEFSSFLDAQDHVADRGRCGGGDPCERECGG